MTGPLPGPGSLPEASFDQRQLRDVFGCFATGVTIVTAAGPDGPVGLTVNSFTSVSLDPPMLLFCIDRRTTSLPVFEAADAFAVNVLHAGQERLAAEFACRGADRFGEVRWTAGGAGAPVLEDAMATLECRRHSAHDGGDHRIFIGRVTALRCDPSFDPLLVFQGRYRSVHVPD
ncbi:MAG TPA: flavin reductase family protein [Phenylobacterium sp.]|jgi:flavin reductase (DIM6/NTAB) family NADH-FMN oxidoreductase RutF